MHRFLGREDQLYEMRSRSIPKMSPGELSSETLIWVHQGVTGVADSKEVNETLGPKTFHFLLIHLKK